MNVEAKQSLPAGWPSDPVKRVETATRTLIPPDMVDRTTAPANAPATYDSHALGSANFEYRDLDTKARAAKYLANAKRRGWRVTHVYPYEIDSNGRADGMGYVLRQGGVEADLGVQTNHQLQVDVLQVRIIR